VTNGNRSQNSAVGITTGYHLNGEEVRIRFPVGQEISLLRVFRIGFGVHPTFYPMGTGVISSTVKRRTVAEVKKNVGLYIHSPNVFMA
jgi:hypothetical protein